MLHLAADEPDARIPATEGEVISYAERVKRAAIRQWFAVNGLSSCVHRGAGRSCTGKDRKGCVLHTWEVKTSLVGSHVTLRYTMPNPLDPSKPLRFLEVRIDSGARACLMTYGTLGGRPCTVSQEWLDRASASAKVEFVVNDVEWLDYVCPQWPLEGDVVDETEERDPVVIPKAQVGFNFYYLPAVLGFFLPEVGHAQQCVCVSSKQYFCRVQAAGTGESHVPTNGMPYTFYTKAGDIRATLGAVVVPSPPPKENGKDHGMKPGEYDHIHVSSPWTVRPVYTPNDCIGFLPVLSKSSVCEQCIQLRSVARKKFDRAHEQMRKGDNVSVRGSSLFVPRTTNPDVLKAHFGPYGKVGKTVAPFPNRCGYATSERTHTPESGDTLRIRTGHQVVHQGQPEAATGGRGGVSGAQGKAAGGLRGGQTYRLQLRAHAREGEQTAAGAQSPDGEPHVHACRTRCLPAKLDAGTIACTMHRTSGQTS